jgi:ketosteroid isomerase-like protein
MFAPLRRGGHHVFKMSRAREEAVQQLYDGFNCGDGDAALAVLDPEVEMQDHPGMADAEWHHGHPGAVQWGRKLWEAFGRFTLEAVEFLEVGDRLVVPTRTLGIGESSGVAVSLQATAVYSFSSAGRICRLEIYGNKDEAMQALGGGCVRPSPLPSRVGQHASFGGHS